MIAVSPGVYTSITPLSSYVQEIPSSTGFICFFSNKGPDNQLKVVTSVNSFLKLYGDPDYLKYGAVYGGGQHVAFSFIQTSPKCYVMRVLPYDATYANRMFFFGAEKPFRLQSKVGSVTLSFSATTGVMSFSSSGIQILGDGYLTAEFPTSDENVWLIVRQDGGMSIRVTGARSMNEATLHLMTGSDVTGSVRIDMKGNIFVNGHGSATIDCTNPLTGSVFMFADDIDMFVYDKPINNITSKDSVDLEVIKNNLKSTFRPLYSLSGYGIIIGSQIDATTYNVLKRRLLPKERSLVKQLLVVPDLTGNTYYTVRIDPNTTNFQIDQLDTAKWDVENSRPYQVVIGQDVYELKYDSANTKLVWKQVSGQANDLWNSFMFDMSPMLMVFGKYRGQYYNGYRINFLSVLNRENTFSFNIYEYKKVSKSEALAGSYYISFDPDAVDQSGQTIFIKDVIDRYSEDVEVKVYPYEKYDELIEFLNNYGYLIQAKVVSDVTTLLTPGWYYIKKDATVGTNTFSIDFSDYLGRLVFIRSDGYLFNNNSLVFSTNIGAILTNEDIIFKDEETNTCQYLTPDEIILPFKFIQNTLVEHSISDYLYGEGVNLGAGTDGQLFLPNGKINDSIAKSLLVQAYTGQIDPNVTDTEFVWYDIVLDGGYPTDVKSSIVTLVHEIRRDCIALLDNGDNKDPQEALDTRMKRHTWNSEYVAIYEPYIQIYDQFSGRDIWVSPVYAVARLLALNDRVNEVWYAVAGYRRGMTPVIKGIRYSPRLSERDDFYLNQINPFVNFREGTVLWGQLTSRRITDALQNLNVMRLILYCKRALEQYCKYFIFEFNDSITWENIKKGVTGFLADVQRRRGLYSFSVNVWADEYAILRKSAYLDVVLFPTRALEKIYLNFYVK